MKRLIENFQAYSEGLSKKEKIRRKNRKIFGSDPKTDWKDDELDALGRGIIRASADPDLEEGCEGNPYHAGKDGKFSSKDEPGSWALGKKKDCKGGQARRAAGSTKAGKSEKECGRSKRSDGKQYKCKSGDLRENDLDLDPEIDAAYLKAIVEKSVNQAVKSAMASVQKQTGCSLQQCLRMVNQLNQAEDGDLGKKKK